MKHTMVFDTETTGLTLPEVANVSQQPHIIEIGAALLDEKRKVIDKFSQLIKPPFPLSPEITKITGLRDTDLATAPGFAEVLPRFTEFVLGCHRLCAHNLPFDLMILTSELRRLGREFAFPYPPEQFCTAELALQENGKRPRLIELHKLTLGKEYKQTHRALDDVMALVRILQKR